MSATIASQRAEEAVIAALLISEDARINVIGDGLEPEHFHYRPYRLAYEDIVERFYGDDAVDPLSVAESVGPAAAKAWGIEEREVVDRFVALAAQHGVLSDTTTREHAEIIRRHAHYRELTRIASGAMREAIEQQVSPEEIAGVLSAAATRIVTGTMIRSELLPYADLGRRWTRTAIEEVEARAAGAELGAFFGIKAIDEYVKGLRPTELMMFGGDPGVGKSAVAWAMARGFALRQMRKAAERRVATLVLSLEMGEHQSSTRFAQMESGVLGESLRTGDITRTELRAIAQKWAVHRDLPLIVNHSGELRESQIRALCIDAIRRHNVGLVIVDHFRFIKTDERFESKNDADEQVVKFLKSTLAKDLNLAVVCMAHTVKGEDRRPVMDDLRGSKMISAFADVVSFLYWPWKTASQDARERGAVGREEFEVIHDKVRQGKTGTGEMWIDMSTMTIR